MRRETSSDDAAKPENPQAKANWLSMFLFCYTIPLFREGRKRDMVDEDLTKPLDEHKAEILGEKLARMWAQETEICRRKETVPNLTYVIFKCFLKPIIVYGVILFVMEIVMRMFQPLFIGLLLRFFENSNKNATNSSHPPMYLNRVFNFWQKNQTAIQEDEAYVYALGIFLCSVGNVLIIHPCLMGIMHLGMKIRVACCSLIYRKALRLTLEAASGVTAGNAINLMSNDVNRFDVCLLLVHYLWISPVQLLCSLYFMYREVGMAAVLGSIPIFVFIPLQAWFGNRTSTFRLKTAIRTDERVRQMNEIIQGMQVIKMYTWEYAFSELIHKLRREEIVVLKQTSYIRGMIMSFIMFTTRLAIFLTVLCYILRHDDITAEKVFVVTAYYQILRQTMTLFFPQGIAQVAEANVTISRIKAFLMMPECNIGDPTPFNPLATEKFNRPTDGQETATLFSEEDAFAGELIIDNATAQFGEIVCLKNVNLEVERGELTTVIGPVGAGKSSLLHIILGELELTSGDITVKGGVSYACQEPWLFAGSVRQNILFGHQMDPRRYAQVVKVCALLRDFAILPNRDLTIVGERGVSLSGGQRARINLARAVYKHADIYLLDDPLSAVDANVGKQLFEDCITEFLKNKIVILVTHQLQFLSHVPQVVLMNEGSMVAKGSYQALQRVSGINFTEFLRHQLPVDESPEDEDSAPPNKLGKLLRDMSITSKMSLNVIDKEGLKDAPKEEAELHTTGSLGCYVYKEYFKAGGNCCWLTSMVSLFFLAQFWVSVADYFLSEWANYEEKTRNNETIEEDDVPIWGHASTQTSIAIYSIIIIMIIASALIRSFVFFTICMRASTNLHDRMFDSLILASMKFFNTNNSGRILNRFSNDLGAVDELLPNAMIDSSQILLNLAGAIVVVSCVNPYLIIPIIVMTISFYFLRKFYLHTSRSIKRLEGISRSPIIAHLNATLQGLTTIRSHRRERILTKEFDRYQDVHSSAWFMFISTSRALGFWLDAICTLFIGIVAFSFLIFSNAGSRVGMAVTQAIGLSGMFQWGLKQSAELENQMTSVERILEYTVIEHEPNLESDPDKQPPPDWPSDGRVTFENVVMRYKPQDPPVLKSLSFQIESREKIGIVGRTGAGKSSLIGSLFRISPFEGSIIIDEIDTHQIGLHDLRRKISIIPQEPVLFSGTLRYNMDPFDQYDDASIVNALIVVEIKTAMIEGIGCLSHYMSEGGVNFSVGERQMVCLARAILRNNVILVLDEATANVDAQTDDFIQETIRTKFANCTVFTIAHRLHTVMDSDKVLVMDAGEAVEFDHPHNLLQITDGFFTQMVEKTGHAMEENLRKVAKESYDRKHSEENTD